MKISIKEAHAIAVKAFGVQQDAVRISISLGRHRWQSTGKWDTVKWDVEVHADDQTYSDGDEMFSVALARVAAEMERAKAKPVEDVTVETDEAVAVGEAPMPEEPEVAKF